MILTLTAIGLTLAYKSLSEYLESHSRFYHSLFPAEAGSAVVPEFVCMFFTGVLGSRRRFVAIENQE